MTFEELLDFIENKMRMSTATPLALTSGQTAVMLPDRP
jgi:hypothetical protein